MGGQRDTGGGRTRGCETQSAKSESDGSFTCGNDERFLEACWGGQIFEASEQGSCQASDKNSRSCGAEGRNRSLRESHSNGTSCNGSRIEGNEHRHLKTCRPYCGAGA